MICIKCDKDLAACICPDLEERFERISKSDYLFIGEDYKKRIREQIERNKREQSESA